MYCYTFQEATPLASKCKKVLCQSGSCCSSMESPFSKKGGKKITFFYCHNFPKMKAFEFVGQGEIAQGTSGYLYCFYCHSFSKREALEFVLLLLSQFFSLRKRLNLMFSFMLKGGLREESSAKDHILYTFFT